MSFSENLSYLRKKKNITQDQLASYLKVSRSTIAGYETRNREPEYCILAKIADYFQVSTDLLLGHSVSQDETSNISSDDDKNKMHASASEFITIPPSVTSEKKRQLESLLEESVQLSERDILLLIHLAKDMHNV